MIESIVSVCFRRRGIVWLVFLAVALYGAWSWTQLPLEAYPDIADVTSQVVTQVPGLAAEEVEQQITVPLERALLGTLGMEVLRSRSVFGLSLITVVFADGTDGYFARQRLQERLNEVTLPYNAAPGLAALHLRGMTLNVSSAVGFIALFGVAVLNAVLLLAQINRLRPVLTTATVAALGLTRAMLATGLGSDVQCPLATVVVGGLVTATVLTLLLLPSLYHLIETMAAARAQRAAASAGDTP